MIYNHEAVTQEVKNIIARAVALLESKGWCQGISRDGHDRMCMVGAIGHVSPRNTSSFSVNYYAIACRHVAMVIYGKVDQAPQKGISDWNDIQERTFDEVLALLRKAWKTPLLPGNY